MFKIAIMAFLMTSTAFAQECTVYGITKSPQSLSCTFPHMTVKLSCVNGKYFLNRSVVNVAFHLEVEEGTVPLVFKASDMQMTVLMDRPITAELEAKKASIPGTCR